MAYVPALMPDDFDRRAVLLPPFAGAPLGTLGPTHDLFGDGSAVLVELPGHARGQMGLLAQTLRGRIFFAADSVWLSASYRERRPPHRMTHLFIDDPVAMHGTIDRLHDFAAANPDVAVFRAIVRRRSSGTLKASASGRPEPADELNQPAHAGRSPIRCSSMCRSPVPLDTNETFGVSSRYVKLVPTIFLPRRPMGQQSAVLPAATERGGAVRRPFVRRAVKIAGVGAYLPPRARIARSWKMNFPCLRGGWNERSASRNGGGAAAARPPSPWPRSPPATPSTAPASPTTTWTSSSRLGVAPAAHPLHGRVHPARAGTDRGPQLLF